MLRTRVITAVVAVLVLLAMLFFASAAAWAIFALALGLIGCWEWSRLCGFRPGAAGVYLVLSGAAGGALLTLYLRAGEALFRNVAEAGFVAATCFWILAVPAWLALRLRPAPWAAGLAGWLVLWPAWAAIVQLRQASPWILLAAAALVWVADIAAYFAGHRFGRVKLAPEISPGKTREGVVGALLGVLAYGIVLDVIAHLQPGPISAIFAGHGGVLALAAMVVLALVSVLGDLFESWMKRGAGVKDSSSLLPGHGGLLDRIDALTSALPVAAFMLSFVLA
jgi:phosphatidate cytidylyltransferase